jgi:UDP-N-acetylmuramoyl-L-alanyl-D-glutamate--2,6-diaminopimelate ligase
VDGRGESIRRIIPEVERMIKLKKVIKNIEFSMIKGSKEVEILGLSSHSKSVAPGFLFIAKKGDNYDGTEFIPDAILAGAVAIVTDFYNPFYENVVQLIHSNVNEIESLLAKNFYKDPSLELFLVGITGTNGKTSTSYIVKHLLDGLGETGLMGTIEVYTGSHRIESSLTTPEVTTTNKFLKEMVQNDCKHAVMEVSSIGVDQGRINNLDFDIGIFTNLTPEHLDYHHDLESYAKAKKSFLTRVKDWVILNRDSDYYSFIREGLNAKILTYSLEDETADLYGENIHLSSEGITFSFWYREKSYNIEIPLIGKHNVYNTLAAIGAALVRGVAIKMIIERLKRVPGIPGRLEKVGCNIFVDYAHKPDALENVLKTLKEFCPQKLIVVFGCGGDRDPFKRPVMANITEKYADFSIVTSDNPRSEDPNKILEEIVKGFHESKFAVEVDRRRAIEKAISMASSADIVLIAGKGHETNQVIGHCIFDFDDRLVAKEICLLN